MWDILLEVILIALALIIISILSIYNKLVRLRNSVKQAQSGIDVYLNQRFDLIPNLVETVKGYSKHEQGILTDITELRTSYMKEEQNLKKAENLNNKINQLLAVSENYPDLKADGQYINLQKNLSKLENQLQEARRIYNIAVTNFNNKRETIPSSFIASLFGFEKAELFEIEDYKRENVKIKIDE